MPMFTCDILTKNVPGQGQMSFQQKSGMFLSPSEGTEHEAENAAHLACSKNKPASLITV